MVKTIYVDILFLINLIINYLILFACSRIGAIHIRRLRIFLGAAVGAIYGILVFFPSIPFISSLPIKIGISVLIVICAFGISDIPKMTLLFLVVSLAFGGVILAMSLIGTGDFFEIRGGIYYIHISLPALLFSSSVAYAMLAFIFRRSAGQSDKKVSSVILRSGERQIELLALHDTGNSLRDPQTNAPVVITDYQSMKPVLPPPIQNILDRLSPSSFVLALDEISNYGVFKLIPYKTVGVDFSLMLTYLPDEVTIDKKTIPGASVAIAEQRISDGGAYSALI